MHVVCYAVCIKTPQQEWQILKQIVELFKAEHLSVNTNEWERELSHWWWWEHKGTAIMAASCMLGGNT